MIWLNLVLGFILRLISLNQSFWLDEATSANVVKNYNFVEIITKFSPGDFHPPFYYLLLKLWSIPFGVSEISLRILSVFAGLGLIYIVYLIGKEIKNKSFGETVSLLVAASPLLVYYSQEARAYMFETLLVSSLIYFFLKILKKGKFIYWTVFSFLLLLLGATDYLPLLVIPVLWVYALVKKKKVDFFSKLALSHVPLGIGFAAWAPYFAAQLTSGLSVRTDNPGWWQVLGKAGVKELALLPVKFIIGRVSFDNKVAYGVIGFVLLAFFGYLIVKSVKTVKKNLLVFLWLAVPIGLAFLLSFKLSVFSYFRLIFVLPAFYLAVALGLYGVKKKVFPLLFLALVFVNIAFSLGYLLNPKFQREDWRGVVAQINNSPVVFPAKSQREAFLYYDPQANIVESENLKELDPKNIYLMRYVQDIFDPEDKVRTKIEDLNYKKSQEYNFNGVVVWRYEK